MSTIRIGDQDVDVAELQAFVDARRRAGGDPIRPASTKDLLALFDRRLLTRDELRRYLGLPALAPWWRRLWSHNRAPARRLADHNL